MQRLLLLLLASLFLMAMKCGPAPCQDGKAIAEITINSWASFSQEGVDSIRVMLNFPNGRTDTGMAIVDSMLLYDDRWSLEFPNDSVVCNAGECRVVRHWVQEDPWYIVSHDDSVTLPAHVNIAFFGNGGMLDSIGLNIKGNTQTDLIVYKGSEPLGPWSKESVLDYGCVQSFCWITRPFESSDTCAD